MGTTNRKFTDLAGAEVEIEPCLGGIFIHTKLTGDEYASTSVDFEGQDAELFADAIYEAVGAQTKSTATGDGVKASDISFNEAIIRTAAVHDRTITFRYAKGEGAMIEQRTLVPEGISSKGGHTLVSGVDLDRQDYRAYRLDRIKGDVQVVV